MFRFEPIKTFTAPVRVTTPAGELQEFEASFSYLSDSEFERVGQVPRREFLAQHWLGWSGIQGADGSPLEFSADTRHALLDHAYVTLAVMAAYADARAGLRAKN